MKTSTYYLELGCEEIPARFIPGLVADLERLFIQYLSKANLAYSGIQLNATYRRLCVQIDELQTQQDDQTQWVKGPPKERAFDDNGQPTVAATGFAKKNNVAVTDLDVKPFNNREHVAVCVHHKGQSASAWLATAVPEIIKAVPLPIAMRWGAEPDVFVRPIHWIVSMLDNKVVPFTLFGVLAGNTSYAHRFLSKASSSLGKSLKISHANKAATQLREQAHVEMSATKRRNIIMAALKKKKQSDVDQELLEETVYLTEWPEVIEGTFDAKYLAIPEPVLVACMKKHQRYFPVYHQAKLVPRVLIVADNVTQQNKATIINGNERVLAARLDDALFFYNEDKQHALEYFTPKLNGVVFHKSAGTIYDKQERIASILKCLCDQNVVSLPKLDLKRLASLAKADLVTQLVVEFPSLQGQMGAHYATLSGEDKALCEAIGEQYLPAGSGSALPQSEAGIALALADRFDTLVTLFHGGVNPTGSQDPLGLRRAVNGIFQILYHHQRACDINAILDFCYSILAGKAQHQDRLKAFLSTRIMSLLGEWGLSKHAAQAVHHLVYVSAQKAVSAAQALTQLQETEPDRMKVLAETAIRVQRLAKKANSVDIKQQLCVKPEEKALLSALKAQQQHSKDPSLKQLEELSQVIIPFFDNIMVMDKDEALKNNRLALLKAADSLFMKVAQFEAL